MRSGRKYQAAAVSFRAKAIEQYLALDSLSASVRTAVDELIARLGPRDGGTLRTHAGKIIENADGSLREYLEYSGEADPQSRLRTKEYAAMAHAFETHTRKLAKRLSALQSLHTTCQVYTLLIDGYAAKRNTAATVLKAAREALNHLTGWSVAEIEGELSDATTLREDAEVAYAGREYVTADKLQQAALDTAQKVTTAIRMLPRQQQNLRRQAADFRTQADTLVHRLQQAEAALPVLRACYDENACRGLAEELQAARAQHNQLAILIEQLLHQAQPDQALCAQGAKTAELITDCLQDIEATCQRIVSSKSAFDHEIRSIFKGAQKLREEIYDSIAAAQERVGDQDIVFEALNVVIGQVALLTNLAGGTKPHPAQLRLMLDNLKEIVDALDDASEQMEYDDDEHVIDAIAVSAKTLLGIKLLADS